MHSDRDSGARHGGRTILVTLDGSTLAERALAPAESVARHPGASVVLLRVVAARNPDAIGAGAIDLEEAERYLVGVADRMRAHGLVVLVEACAGRAAERIVRGANLWRAEMIVMSTHGRGGVDRLVHGSVADAVLRTSDVPVLLVPARGRGTLEGDAIVVPVDGSEFAELALARGAELARELATPLAVVHAIFWSPTQMAGLAPSPDAIDEMLDEARVYVAGLADGVRRAGVEARGDVEIGTPASTILDYAARRNAAAIVMATHGRGGLSRFTFGSVASSVLGRASCPVLTIRPELRDPVDESRRLAGSVQN